MADSDTLIDLCAVTEVNPDMPFKATINGEDVAVFQVGEAYYVTQDLCTHGPGSLSEGFVAGEEVECPFHQGRFNIVTGEAIAAPCTIALKTWKACAKGGRICAVQ